MHRVVAFAAGVVFAIGLGISGMTIPAKVIGFLDFFGSWDPSLMFVMGGAVVVYFIAFRVIRGYSAPVLGDRFHLPTRKEIDKRLLFGSALFGVGWGLAGYCPGPALTSLPTASTPIITFVASMLIGMFLFKQVVRD